MHFVQRAPELDPVLYSIFVKIFSDRQVLDMCDISIWFRFFILFALVEGIASGTNASKPFEQIKISLVIESPGNELYSVYGHAGFRIREKEPAKDYFFHYGLFNFSAPGFYTHFLQGLLLYKMGGQYFSALYKEAELEGRGLYELSLDLDSAQTMQLYQLLHTNYKKENRPYYYDFLYDNCATKPRDLLEKVLGDKLMYADTFPKKTYRQLLSEHQRVLPWIDYGIDLIIGSEVDQSIGIRDQAFLPVYLRKAFVSALVQGKPVVVEERTMIAPHVRPNLYFYQRPVFVFLLLFVLELFLFVYALRNGVSRWIHRYDLFFYSLVALMSAFILLLWLGTNHHITKNNWNILWLNPLFILLVIAGWWGKKGLYNLMRKVLFALMVLVFVIGLIKVLPQPFHIASFVLMAILVLKLGRDTLLKIAHRK